jgi:hypothetical protein
VVNHGTDNTCAQLLVVNHGTDNTCAQLLVVNHGTDNTHICKHQICQFEIPFKYLYF